MVNVKELAKKEEGQTGGHFACAGCGPALGQRLATLTLGAKKTIVVNASGCMTLLPTWPFTPHKTCWVLNAIENAASTATGILMGLKALKKEKETTVICYAGDGATYDIGFQALSGAAYRNDNIIYICYNNSCFANTGFQRSAGTPLYARTTLTPVTKKSPYGNLLPRKHMAKIVAAHGAPYVATACTGYPIDFITKLQKAAKIEGFKFIDLLAACEPGWLVEADKMIEVAKKIVDTGIWPLYEIENKQFKLTLKPPMTRVEEALKLQGRYKHLTKEMISDIQKIVNKEWEFLNKGDIWNSEEY